MSEPQSNTVTVELSDLEAHIKRALGIAEVETTDDSIVEKAYAALEILMDAVRRKPDASAAAVQSEALSDEQLNEMQGRADKASPAPWIAHGTQDNEGLTYTHGWLIWTSGSFGDGRIITASLNAEGYVAGGVNSGEFAPADTDEAGQNSNAEFAAHARTDIPLLVAEVRRLRQRESELLHNQSRLLKQHADDTRTVASLMIENLKLRQALQTAHTCVSAHITYPTSAEREEIVTLLKTEMVALDATPPDIELLNSLQAMCNTFGPMFDNNPIDDCIEDVRARAVVESARAALAKARGEKGQTQ